MAAKSHTAAVPSIASGSAPPASASSSSALSARFEQAGPLDLAVEAVVGAHLGAGDARAARDEKRRAGFLGHRVGPVARPCAEVRLGHQRGFEAALADPLQQARLAGGSIPGAGHEMPALLDGPGAQGDVPVPDAQRQPVLLVPRSGRAAGAVGVRPGRHPPRPAEPEAVAAGTAAAGHDGLRPRLRDRRPDPGGDREATGGSRGRRAPPRTSPRACPGPARGACRRPMLATGSALKPGLSGDVSPWMSRTTRDS